MCLDLVMLNEHTIIQWRDNMHSVVLVTCLMLLLFFPMQDKRIMTDWDPFPIHKLWVFLCLWICCQCKVQGWFEIMSTRLLPELCDTKTAVVPFTSFENCSKLKPDLSMCNWSANHVGIHYRYPITKRAWQIGYQDM